MHLAILPSNILPIACCSGISGAGEKCLCSISLDGFLPPCTWTLSPCTYVNVQHPKRKFSPYFLCFSLHMQHDWTGCCFKRTEHVLLLVTNQCYISKSQKIVNPDSHFHFSETHSFAVLFVIPELSVFCGLTFQGLVLCLVNFVYSLILHEFSSAFLQEVYVMSARIPV